MRGAGVYDRLVGEYREACHCKGRRAQVRALAALIDQFGDMAVDPELCRSGWVSDQAHEFARQVRKLSFRSKVVVSEAHMAWLRRGHAVTNLAEVVLVPAGVGKDEPAPAGLLTLGQTLEGLAEGKG